MKKEELTAENLIKSRFTSYSEKLTEVHKKLAALDEEKKKLVEYGKQLTGALNAMQDILKDTMDASIMMGIECSDAKPSSA